MIPVVMSTVASIGLPLAIPPRKEKSSVVVRRKTLPASRNRAAEIEPVVDHLQHGAVEAERVAGEQARA